MRNSAVLLFRGGPGALEFGQRMGIVLLVAYVTAACSLAGDYEPQQATGESRPGAPTPGACRLDDDCANGQSCLDGVCRVPMCGLDLAGTSCEACVGSDCPLPDQLSPSCSDSIRNGDEADVDCGGSCPERCAAGSACTSNADCESSCVDGACGEPSCSDGVRNQDERDVDCGGSCAERCGANQVCASDTDCAGDLICSTVGVCTSASCDDEQLNGSESDVDCGGSCPGCPDGAACAVDSDCANRECADGLCTAPTCDDGTLNQDETATDCGGTCEALCGDGDACAAASDCESGVCGTQACEAGAARCCQVPACTDDIVNGNESDLDCGGTCPDCADLSACRVGGDCESGACNDGVCVSCQDGDQNGSETDEDCGGPNDCVRCAPGLACVVDADCASNACQDGRCCGGTLSDCTRCAERLSPTLSCLTGPPAAQPLCSQFLECLRDNADVCTTRFAPGCSGESDVCNHNVYGGDGGIALTFVTQILAEAACTP